MKTSRTQFKGLSCRFGSLLLWGLALIASSGCIEDAPGRPRYDGPIATGGRGGTPSEGRSGAGGLVGDASANEAGPPQTGGATGTGGGGADAAVGDAADASDSPVVGDAGVLDVPTSGDMASSDLSGDGSAPPTDAGGDAPPVPVAACRMCPVGKKFCNGLCLSPTDPLLGCGKACFPCVFVNAAGQCDSSGRCSMGACRAGFADCNHDPKDGCEVDLSGVANCGACGTKCSGVCTATGCADACLPPLTNCDGRCLDVSTSVTACGGCFGCGTAPNATISCTAGECAVVCSSGLTACPRAFDSPDVVACSDLMNDPFNCGACGRVCFADKQNGYSTCSQGTCGTAHCLPGWTACPGAVGDICTYLPAAASDCGTCGHACGSDEYCERGTCHPQSEQLLVGGLDQPEDIVVNRGEIFFSALGSGSIYRLPIAGGTPVQLATAQAQPSRIAVDATHVYWTNKLGAAIMRVVRNGSAAAELVIGAPSPNGIALDSEYIYWSESTTSDGVVIRRAPKGAGITTSQIVMETLIWSPALPMDLFIVNGTLYAMAGGEVRSVPAGGGTVTVGPEAHSMSFDSSHAFRFVQKAIAGFFWDDLNDPYETGRGVVLATATATPLVATPCGAQFKGGFFPLAPGSGGISGARATAAIGIPSPPVAGDDGMGMRETVTRISYENGYVYWTERGTSPSTGLIRKVRMPILPP